MTTTFTPTPSGIRVTGSARSALTIRIGFILALLVLSSPGAGTGDGALRAQWKQLGNPLSTAMYCSYFFDANHGVVAGVGGIWRYNSGQWFAPNSMPTEDPVFFQSLRMLKPGKLYAASGATNLWVTTDSGNTWQNTSIPGSFAYDMYMTKDSVIHTTTAGTFSRIDSNICILTNVGGNVPSYSTNGGSTWTTPTGIVGIGGYGSFGDTCRKMFFASSGPGYVYYSVDSGRTWTRGGANDSTDFLNGTDETVFHQTSQGVWVSPDGGASWRGIGGPSSVGTHHQIFAFGPLGKYVVALHSGQVWMYDRADSTQPIDPVVRPDTTETCAIIRIPVLLRSFTRPYHIRILMSGTGPQSLTPSDTSFDLPANQSRTVWYNVTPTYANQPTHFLIQTVGSDGCRSFLWKDTFNIKPVPNPLRAAPVIMQNCIISKIPLIIAPTGQTARIHLSITADSGWTVKPNDTAVALNQFATDTIYLTPKAPNLPVGTLIHVHATDTVPCMIYAWDSVFAVGIKPKPVALNLKDSISISSCDSMRVPLTLDIASCDSLDIEQLIVTPPTGLLTFESLPHLTLQRGQIDTLWLKYAPHAKTDTTKYSVRIVSHFVPVEGYRLDTTLLIKAAARASTPPKALAAATLNIKECEPVAFPLSVLAAGCENIRIDSVRFGEAGLIVSGGPSGTDTVLTGQPDTLRYTMQPLYPGTRTLNVFLYLRRLGAGVRYDTIVSVKLNVSGSNTEPMIAAPATLSLSNCVTSVVPIALHAPCDSAVFTDCALTIDNTMNYTTNFTFPRQFAANQSDTLLISFPPQGLNKTTVIYAHFKGRFGGTTTTFDSTVQTRVTFACTTGSVENQFEQQVTLTGLQVASNKLRMTIARSDANLTHCRAEIVTVLGEVAGQRSLDLTSSQTQDEWDVSTLPSGEYFLRLECGDYHATRRFVVVH